LLARTEAQQLHTARRVPRLQRRLELEPVDLEVGFVQPDLVVEGCVEGAAEEDVGHFPVCRHALE